MRPRFQADADFNQKIVAAAVRREPAIDFRTADEAGLRGLFDPDVLGRSAADGRVLVSHDLKTMPHHFAEFISHAASPGVLIFPQHLPIGVVVEEVVLIWSVTDALNGPTASPSFDPERAHAVADGGTGRPLLSRSTTTTLPWSASSRLPRPFSRLPPAAHRSSGKTRTCALSSATHHAGCGVGGDRGPVAFASHPRVPSRSSSASIRRRISAAIL